MFAVVIQHATGVLVKEEIVVIEANPVEMLHKNGEAELWSCPLLAL